MKRFLAGLISLVLFGTAAFATDVGRVVGPQDPSNLQAVVNTLIVSGNNQWNVEGPAFLSVRSLSPTSTSVISFNSNLGAAGITTNIVSWLRVRGYTQNSTTPTMYLIPMWGCTGC